MYKALFLSTIVVAMITTAGVGVQTSVAIDCNPALVKGIGHDERFTHVKDCITVTGTVGKKPRLADIEEEGVAQEQQGGHGPHYAPDGDMVFPIKIAKNNQSLLTDGNNRTGGLWIEAICQQQPHTSVPHHQGDCSGGIKNYTHFKLPRVGDKLQITGRLIIDNGTDEFGQAEIHPVSVMNKLKH